MDAAEVDAAAHLILGALNEAALVRASAGPDDPIPASRDRAVERMVRALVARDPAA